VTQKTQKRVVENEMTIARIGSTAAVSSHRADFFNLVSPHTIRRLARRHTGGAIKYGSVQWRQGINDQEYVADRFNHLWEHMLKFMESGNTEDDNIGGMLWALDCLSEAERLCPDAFGLVIGVSNMHGNTAAEFHVEEMSRRKRNEDSSTVRKN
jgi:hypothetical protein